MTDLKNITCWILVEKKLTGTLNQCVGVTQALGITAEIKDIALKQPWKTLSPYLGLECQHSFSTPLTPPWPDLVIAAGRKSIAASRYIKKQSHGHTFTVQIQNPRISSKHFDLVATPLHDNYHKGENIIQTVGAPNKITPQTLEAAKAHFPDLNTLKSPRAAVLIGGNSKTHQLTPAIMLDLKNKLEKLDAGLMITTSRRTGSENLKILQDANFKNAILWDGNGQNPYLAMLAYADFIIVTNDSASMLCDAATTGKPVYTIELQGGSAKFNRLYKVLKDRNIIKPFNGNLDPWSYEPLHDSQIIAQEIKKRINLT